MISTYSTETNLMDQNIESDEIEKKKYRKIQNKTKKRKKKLLKKMKKKKQVVLYYTKVR